VEPAVIAVLASVRFGIRLIGGNVNNVGEDVTELCLQLTAGAGHIAAYRRICWHRPTCLI